MTIDELKHDVEQSVINVWYTSQTFNPVKELTDAITSQIWTKLEAEKQKEHDTTGNKQQ